MENIFQCSSSSSSSTTPTPPIPQNPPPPPPGPSSSSGTTFVCSIGLELISKLGQVDYKCSVELEIDYKINKNKQYHLKKSLYETVEYILNVNSILCKKCSGLFGKRRDTKCLHPNHPNQHKRRREARTLHYITAEEYFIKYKNIGLEPNDAICRDHCRKEETTNVDSDSSGTDEPPTKKKVIENINQIRTITTPKAPPVSLAKRNIPAQVKLVKSELSNIKKTIQEQCQEVGIPIEDKREDLKQLQQDSKDLNWVMENLKIRMTGCSQAEQKTLLTCVPPSWSIEKTQLFFGVGKKMIQKSRKIRDEANGILPPIKPKAGRKMKEETRSKIQEFYYQDDVSRACPGQKDVLSVKNQVTGKKEHKQKRLLLCNLKELYQNFKIQFPECKIGKSSFMMLRPKECVSLTTTGFHNVCVCVHHENVKLLFYAIKIQSIKPLILELVCNNAVKDCYYRRCLECKNNILKVKKIINENDKVLGSSTISYRRWTTTDGTEYVVEEKPTPAFVDFAAEQLEKVLKHHYLSKCQHEYLRNLKTELKENELVVWGDFAENYSPVIQNAIQSDHWNHKQVTIHPFTVYWNVSGTVLNKSISVISDHMTHDTNTFYAFQSMLIPKLKQEFDEAKININHIHYFSDGCAGQYKNRKNFSNLFHHKKDFGWTAEWHFFASGHGKGPCDAQGGTTKRSVKTASLQGTVIQTAQELYDYCSSNVKGIEYIYISKEDVQTIVENKDLESRYNAMTTIAGTQQVHRVEIGEDRITCYETSNDNKVIATRQMRTSTPTPSIDIEDCFVNDWIACVYEGEWYLANIDEVEYETQEVLVTFWKNKGGTSFVSEKTVSHVALGNIIKKVHPTCPSKRKTTVHISEAEQLELDTLLPHFLQ